jgi:hypothetical protein
MHRLCQNFSPPLLTLDDPDDLGSTTYHPFPRPEDFPTPLETILREMGFGYRAGFIEASIATLKEEFGDAGRIQQGIEAWRSAPVDDVREKLLALKGVGRKVADCVMLMCLDQVGDSRVLADNSHRSYPSTHTSLLLPLDILPFPRSYGTNQCRSLCTRRLRLSYLRSGVLWEVGLRRSCSLRIYLRLPPRRERRLAEALVVHLW